MRREGWMHGPASTGGSGERIWRRRALEAMPGLRVMQAYRRSWFRHDLVAGLALTAILVPAGMGYAQASGLPPITGLYASILPLLAYALVGPSRILVLGPDSSLVPLIAVAVLPLAAGDPGEAVALAALLSILTGMLVIAGGLARFGFLTDLLSLPVRHGYLDGIAAIVIASQLPKLFGFSGAGETLVAQLRAFATGLADGRTNSTALVVGLVSLAAILAIRRWRPEVPAILVAVVGATLVSALLRLGPDQGIALVGPMPAGLPALSLPGLDPARILALAPAAFGIALVSATDMTVLSRTYAERERHRIDQNQELVALGVANIASGLFGGFAVSSSASRTPVAEAAGARTQLAGVVGALVIALLLVVAPGLLADLPIATLGAVVIAAALTLVDIGSFVRLWRTRRSEFLLGLASFVGVAFVGVIEGIFLAVGLSLLAFVRRAWSPHDAVLGRADGVKGYHDLGYYPRAKQIPGLVLYRFDAPLFFANADVFRDRIRGRIREAHPRARWVVIAAEPITDVDTTAARVLEELLDELAEAGVTLAFAGMKDPVKDRLRAYRLLERIGEDRFFPTMGTAVDAYVEATGQPWVDWEEAAEGPPASGPTAEEPLMSAEGPPTQAEGPPASGPGAEGAPTRAKEPPRPAEEPPTP